MKSGVYRILNIVTGKCYVGSATHIAGRWNKHRKRIKEKTHSRKLQNALNKYGADNFEFSVLEYCEPEECVVREQYWIDFLDSYKNGYNSRPFAESQFGFRHSTESIQKMKGKPGWNKGARLGPEASKRMREMNVGRIPTLEARKNMSKARMGKPGNPHSEESKKKLSIANTGKILSLETRQKIGKAKKGKPGPMLGKHHSEETKQKMKGRVPWNKGLKKAKPS